MVEIAALSGFNGSVNLGASNTSGLSITFQAGDDPRQRIVSDDGDGGGRAFRDLHDHR